MDVVAVVAGEALVDLTPGSTADGRDALVPVLGGAPLNVAVAAARLGAAVGWSGPVGSDAFAGLVGERLKAEGIDAGAVVQVDAPTSLAVVHLDDEGRASYGFYLDGTSTRATGAVVPELPDGAALVVCAGAIGFEDPPYGAALAEALRREAGRRPVWLDPNVRPSAVDDPARYLALLDGLVAGCDVVKVSDEDLAALVGGGAEDAMQVARRWAGSGPAMVVATLGPDGLLALRDDGREVRVDGVAVEVVDTVGAGDTVTGALLAGLAARDALGAAAVRALPDDDVAAVLAAAAAAAAVTCTRRGADPPRADELG